MSIGVYLGYEHRYTTLPLRTEPPVLHEVIRGCGTPSTHLSTLFRLNSQKRQSLS